MHLKRIHAYGFKSFADKTNIEVKNGITGIVGPNGSGKSNVVDAIKWVLGEQSVKVLRGNDSMSDVIFNGSKTRDKATRAIVSLTIDNEDHYLNSEFNEIEIKRVLYKTGENEYFLNNAKVRLKDITDLFLDSGASSKSFNIISQGTVTDIINNKPENRRVIFEEAAEVLKYKKRKEDTLRKLDRTEDNLEKVNLIINELENQVEPLKDEAEKAKKYLEYAKELESKEISLIAKDLKNINFESKNLKEEQKDIQEKIDNIDVSNSKENALLESLRLKKIKIEENISKNQEKSIELTKEIADLEAQKQLVSERKKYEVDDLKLESNIINLKEEELTIQKNITTLEDEINNIKKEYEKVNKDKKKLEDDILNLTHKHYTLEGQINNKNKKILELTNKIDILKNNLEENASVPYAVKQILNNPRFDDIYGTISNLITVDEEYINAISVSLGANNNVLVVKNENTAKEAIEYLKNNHLGRATFFPLNIIKGRNIDNESLEIAKKNKGFIDIASNLVDFDNKYENIIENQLGNVLVVKTIDDVNALGKDINYKYRVVSLDGEILFPGGALTGGSINKKDNSYSLKEELKKLNNEMETLQSEAKNQAKEYNELLKNEQEKNDLLRDLQTKVINIKEKIDSKEVTLSDLEKQYNQKHQELVGTKNVKNNSLDKEIEKLLENYYKKNTEKELLQKEINNLKLEQEELFEKIDEYENKNRTLNSEYNSLQNKLKDIEIKLGKMDVQIDNYLNILNETYSMTYERALEISDLDIYVDDTKIIVSKLKNKIKSLGEVSVSSIAEFKRVNERYQFLIKQKDDISKSIEELQDLICSMDEIMIKRFKETFDSISKEFSLIFKELFKGGTGKLVLTDPDNLLETGIEIIAEPPGKKLSSIALLSGGEKTLTAISLLFAILKVRPVPFVILDEVEAALDDPNVLAFSNYLKHEKDKTQFIIITHKKKTMEYVDQLYGITMQEAGVSKLVSVELKNG